MTSIPSIWRKSNQRYNLDGNQCLTCHQEFFPPRTVCPACGIKAKLKHVPMPRSGKIISFTEVFSGPAGFEHETPYFMALVELPNSARILTQIVDSSADTIRTGARVQKVFRKISDIDPEGPIAYGYKFKVLSETKKA
ncbi:MAG: Zn-ribbon domain-containing OB-fold protein [Candidatus Diapherotrites archaeon]|nr:Zn-ribbon domain-containing OB-fold protein [Candidatus Diapherotrites archaeon]